MTSGVSASDPLADKWFQKSQERGIAPQETEENSVPIDDPIAQKWEQKAMKKAGMSQDSQNQGSPQVDESGVHGGYGDGLYGAFMTSDRETRTTFLKDALRLAVKAPAAAASSILDFFSTMPINAVVSAINGLADTNIPHAQTMEQTTEKGVDALTLGATEGSGHVYEGTKIATSLLIPSTIASKLTTEGQKLLNNSPALLEMLQKIGSANPKTLAGGMGAGAAMSEAKEQGADSLTTMGAGMGGALATEALLSLNPKKILQTGARTAGKILGVGEKHLDRQAIESGKVLDVEVPLSAASDSAQVAAANQTLSKAPIPVIPKLLQSVKDNTHGQYHEAYQKLLKEVSPDLEKPFNQAVDDLYKETNALFRPNDKIDFSPAMRAAEEILEKTQSATYSAPTLTLRKHAMDILEFGGKQTYLEEALQNTKAWHTATPQMKEQMLTALKEQGMENSEQMASAVLRTKIELNKVMKDKNLFTRADKDSLDMLNHLQGGIKDSLQKYGKNQNLEWLNAFQKAEKTYGHMARRKDLENLLDDVMSLDKTGSPDYRKLMDIFSKKEYASELKNALGEKQFEKVQHFFNVAKAMHGINKRIPNPSGTAVLSAAYTVISTLATGSVITGTAGLWGGLGVIYSVILSSPKAADIALKFAQKPSESLASQLNAVLKENTGLGIQALIKSENMYQAQEADEE